MALAAGLLAAATACTGDAKPAATTPAAASSTPSPSASAVAVTKAEAAEVFTAITAGDDLLRAVEDLPGRPEQILQGRLDLEVSQMTGGQILLTAAAFLSTDYAPPRYKWGSPTVYVPRFPATAQGPWFSVLATRDGRPALLTFAKSDRWRLSSVAELLPGQRMPEIQLDADGYATALAADDKTVTISPQFIQPVHASVAETGSAGVTAGLLAPGPYTTEVAEQIAELRKLAKRGDENGDVGGGYSYDSIFSADNFPVYALRTKDGGALIQYSLSRTSTTTAMTKAAEDEGIPVPGTAQWAFSQSRARLRHSLRLVETHQYATAVPPISKPSAAAVIAHDGGLTRASGT
jgi:hypothetical protein